MPFSRWPSSARSLSLAVTTATLAPASANAARIVPARRYFGSFIITSALASRVEEVVAADAVHRRRRAGDDRQVVRVGEPRHDAVGGEARAPAVERGQPRRAARRDRLVDVVGLAAVDADDDERALGPAIAAAVDGDRRGVQRDFLARPRAGAARRRGALPGASRSRLAITCRTARAPRRQPVPRRSFSTIVAVLARSTAAMHPPARASRGGRGDSSLTRRR